jgi:hypothetical protein
MQSKRHIYLILFLECDNMYETPDVSPVSLALPYLLYLFWKKLKYFI